MKQFKDYYNGELHEFRVINKAQRRKMALRLKKLTKSAAYLLAGMSEKSAENVNSKVVE